VSLYAVVFFDARLYADMGLQAIYFALSLYGWWAWVRGGDHHEGLSVSVLSWRQRTALLGLGAVGGLLLGALLHRFTNASLPFADSTLTSFSIVAQWLQTRKRLETWILWITADLFYVAMFLYKELYLTAGLYAVFLLLAALGFRDWRRSMTASAEPPTPTPTAHQRSDPEPAP